jgi:hypothetical protein
LVIKGYLTNAITSLDARTVTYTNPAVNREEYEPKKLHQDWGVSLTNGSVLLGTDPSGSAFKPRTVEIWFKLEDTTNDWVLFDGRPANAGAIIMRKSGFANTTAYINGLPVALSYTASLLKDVWYVTHMTTTNDFIESMKLNLGHLDSVTSKVTIGKVALYPTTLTAAQVLSVYSQYTGVEKIVATESSTIMVTELATPVDVYAYDWAVVNS